jgi:hypothetical protein
MQYAAHLLIGTEKILVLVRTHKTYHSLKIRKSGKDSQLLDDESDYLSQEPELLAKLKSGEVIKC